MSPLVLSSHRFQQAMSARPPFPNSAPQYYSRISVFEIVSDATVLWIPDLCLRTPPPHGVPPGQVSGILVEWTW